MRAAVIATVLLTGQILCAQELKPWKIDRFCGRLEHVEEIPDKKLSNSYSEKTKAIPGVTLKLFDRREGEICCETATPSGEVTTNRRGDFTVDNPNAGQYWLVTTWNDKTYKWAISYEPSKVSTTNCSKQGLKLNNAGDSNWWITITVD